MAEERLEASAASEQAAGNFASGESSPWGKERGNRAFRIITLIALPLLWIGFFHSLFTGNEGNMSSYSLVILMFSLLNADVPVSYTHLDVYKRQLLWWVRTKLTYGKSSAAR